MTTDKGRNSGIKSKIGIALIIIGLFFVMIGCLILLSEIIFISHAVKTQGVIRSIEEQAGDLYIGVTYTISDTDFDYKETHVIERYDHHPINKNVGDTINVYYDPDCPGDVRTFSIMPIIYLIIGACVIAAGCFTERSKNVHIIQKRGESKTGTV